MHHQQKKKSLNGVRRLSAGCVPRSPIKTNNTSIIHSPIVPEINWEEIKKQLHLKWDDRGLCDDDLLQVVTWLETNYEVLIAQYDAKFQPKPRETRDLNISLQKNHLSDKGVDALCRFLINKEEEKAIKKLRSKNNNNNNTTETNTNNNTTETNTNNNGFSLRRLFLYSNNIGDEGAKALSLLVHRARTIWELHLSHNGITDEGAKHLVAAVATAGYPRIDKYRPFWLRLEYNSVEEEPLRKTLDIAAVQKKWKPEHFWCSASNRERCR